MHGRLTQEVTWKRHHVGVIELGWSDWVAVCWCGYRSRRRRTEGLAVEAAIHHCRMAVKSWRSNGGC